MRGVSKPGGLFVALQPMDEFFPVDAVCRCPRCLRVHFLSADEVGQKCGPDFARDTLCETPVVLCESQETLMAAYKLGGEEAALQVLFNGCQGCVDEQHRPGTRRCPVHDH